MGYTELCRLTEDEQQRFYLDNMKKLFRTFIRVEATCLISTKLDLNKAKSESIITFNPQLFDEIYVSFEPLTATAKD